MRLSLNHPNSSSTSFSLTSSRTMSDSKSTLLIYAQGANALLSSPNVSIPERDRCFIDQLTRQSYTGSLALNPMCYCQDEFLYLLGIETKPRNTFSTAFRDAHPHTLMRVITPSSSMHLKATNLTMCSTLIAISSLTNPRYWADLANTWPSFLHLNPDDPYAHTVTLVHVPCTTLEELVFLNQLLPLLHYDQFTQCLMVSSWDAFERSSPEVPFPIETSHAWRQTIHAQSKESVSALELAFRKSPPLSILYYDKNITHPDGIQSFDFQKICAEGSLGLLFSSQFFETLSSYSFSLLSSLRSPRFPSPPPPPSEHVER